MKFIKIDYLYTVCNLHNSVCVLNIIVVVVVVVVVVVAVAVVAVVAVMRGSAYD